VQSQEFQLCNFNSNVWLPNQIRWWILFIKLNIYQVFNVKLKSKKLKYRYFILSFELNVKLLFKKHEQLEVKQTINKLE
jgi:hypothetical protein